MRESVRQREARLLNLYAMARMACTVAGLGAGLAAAHPKPVASGPLASEQANGRLRFYCWGQGQSSSAARPVSDWIIYISADSVYVVAEGSLPDSGNTLRLDAYVQGEPVEKSSRGDSLTAADTAGHWVTDRRLRLRPLSSLPRIGAGRRVVALEPEAMQARYFGPHATVSRLRAVLRTPRGDVLVATIRTGFAE